MAYSERGARRLIVEALQHLRCGLRHGFPEHCEQIFESSGSSNQDMG